MLKAWWKSKTIWVNVIGMAIIIAQAIQGQSWIKPEYQAAILTILNVILRIITTETISTPGRKAK